MKFITQLAKLNAWNGKAHLISIFGTMEFLEINAKNMTMSLLRMTNYIKNKNIK